MAKLQNLNPEMAERGKARRELLGLTRAELAVLLGVSSQRVQQMESEGCDKLSTIRRWAEILGLDPQVLVFGEPEPTKKGKRS